MEAKSTADFVAKLKVVPALDGLDDASLQELAQGLRFRRLEGESTLFHAGDPAEICYIVSYGAFKLTRVLPQGKEVVMCFCRPGDFIGAGVMMNTHPRYPLTAVAVEDSGLIEIPRSLYTEIWQSKPSVARAVNLNMMGRMMEFQQDKAMASAPVAQKIASVLLRLLDQQPEKNGNTISVRLTRKDIAERVGTTVETVIRVLSSWSQKGWISTTDQRITIEDRKAIETLLKEGEA